MYPRRPNLAPTIPDEASEPAGDAAFQGMDLLIPPDQLAPGMVAGAVNAWIIGGEYRQRPAEELLPWACPKVYPQPILDEEGEFASAITSSTPVWDRWISTRIYLPGAQVSFLEDADTITVASEVPDYVTGENWIDVASDAAGLGITEGMFVYGYGMAPGTRVLSLSGAQVNLTLACIAQPGDAGPDSYSALTFVSDAPATIYQRVADSPGPQVVTADPATATTKWTEVGAATADGYAPRAYPARSIRWEVIPSARAARASALWTDASGIEWLAVAERHACRLMAPGATQVLPYPSGVKAAEAACLVSGAGWLALSPGDGSALLFWIEGAPGFQAGTAYEQADSESSLLPAGQALLWSNEGRLISAVGEELHVGRVLSTRYDPATMILRLIGGSGKIRAIVPWQGVYLAFKDRGIFQVSLSGPPQDWGVAVVTLHRGTLHRGSIAAWGSTLAFWDGGEYWTLDQVYGQGTGGVATAAPGLPSLAGVPLSQPIRPGLATVAERVEVPAGEDAATWPKALRPPVLATVWQDRLWLAVPVPDAAADGGWSHEVWLYHTGRGQWESVWRNGRGWQIVSWLLLPEGLAALEWQGGVFRWCARPHPDLGGALLDITSRGYTLGGARRATQRRLTLSLSGQGHRTVVESRTSPAGAWKQAASKAPSATRHKRVGFPAWKTDNSAAAHGLPDREDYAVNLPGEASPFLHLTTAGIEPLREQLYTVTAVIQGEGPYAQVRIRNTATRTEAPAEAVPAGFVSLCSLAWQATPGRRDARAL